MLKKLKQVFGKSKKANHPFNQDLVLARVAIYHQDTHPGEYIEPSLILAEYAGGEWAACGVALRDKSSPQHRFYMYHVLTCEIKEITPTDAEFSMAQDILEKAIKLSDLRGD